MKTFIRILLRAIAYIALLAVLFFALSYAYVKWGIIGFLIALVVFGIILTFLGWLVDSKED